MGGLLRNVMKINCLKCHKAITCYPSQVKYGKKYCSRKCVAHPKKFQKGHKPYGRGLMGHITTEETKEKIRQKRLEFIKNNPDWFKKIKRRNFLGANNPNWRGGKKRKARDYQKKFGKLLWKWRNEILKRDGHKCKICGATERLEAHHIIPLSESLLTALMLMNGVTLCRECHKLTDSYGGKAKFKSRIEDESIGETKVIIRTIPQEFQSYDTLGNYSATDVGDEGVLVIFVSQTGDEIEEMGFAIHEYTEAVLTKHRGISWDEITKFDIDTGLVDPGHSKKAPYHSEHEFANKLERLLLKELGK